MFHGEFEHSLDAKRRLAIPSGFRDLMNLRCAGDSLIAAPGMNGCIWLWPERYFEQATEALRKPEILPDPRTARNATYVFARTATVPFDSAGRIRIPDQHLRAVMHKQGRPAGPDQPGPQNRNPLALQSGHTAPQIQ